MDDDIRLAALLEPGGRILFSGNDQHPGVQRLLRDPQIVQESLTEAIKSAPERARFQKWFTGSTVKDEQGSPLICYHGSSRYFQGDRFRPFTHFGTVGAANAILDKGNVQGWLHRIYPVYLSIKHPVELRDARGTDITAYRILDQLIEDGTIPEEMDEAFFLPGSRRIDVEKFRKYLLDRGIDGFWYQNAVEDAGSESWIILDPSQVWPLFGRTHTIVDEPEQN